nr:rap guanine nucleotide exchange factor 1 [Nothobranchius furzeri]
MSSRPDTKTVSQFTFLTLRLKDRLHPQKPRHSKRVKSSPSSTPGTPDLSSPHKQLADHQRAVVSSLQYFKALVDRLGLDRPTGERLDLDQSVVSGLLGGASGGILEAVQTLVQLELRHTRRQRVSTCLTRLYQSVAQLIRWADQVMLQGASQSDQQSTESVTMVIKAVLDSAKELVRLVAEREDNSVTLSPVLSHRETSDQTSARRSPSEKAQGVRTEINEEHHKRAPPKPPMPLPQGSNPPALPPKTRRSSLAPVPSHCRVAIVTPITREPDEDIQIEQDDACLRRLSTSTESAANKTFSEDDPDYDFLHTDMSSSETFLLLPPTLPEKRCRNTTGPSGSQKSSSFEFDSTHLDTNPVHSKDVSDGSVSSPLSPSKTPPPLPEKKRPIHQYLQFCSSYDDQSILLFYKNNREQQDLDHTHQLLNSAPSHEQLPAPTLPPKKKLQDTADTHTEDGVSNLASALQEVELGQRGSEEEEEEEEVLMLTDQQEILRRITLKSEGEEGPEVKAASKDILLVFATESSSSSELHLYREAFLCTYRGFISPKDVIIKLQRRYRKLSDRLDPAGLTGAKNTFQLLIRVVEDLSAVELDPDLLLLLMELVFCLLVGGELGPAHQLHSNILSKMEKRWKLISSPQSLCPLAAKGVAARPGTLLDFRSQDLAEQLTLLDSELFHKIELPEVLLWSKEQNEERSPHLTRFTQHFNSVSFWVRSVIILQDKAQEREKLLLKFLKVMKHLRKLNNFNSYLSILSALDSAPLRRLDWQRNTFETLEEFSSLIDSSSSFRVYRTALAEVEPPCIPYLGLILQDLTFVHLGNPDTLMTSEGSNVNFSKSWQQFNILDTLRSYQQVRYSLQPDSDIISFFNDFSDHLSEEALWELSLGIRPKNPPRANQR